jgi:hypothetical protein
MSYVSFGYSFSKRVSRHLRKHEIVWSIAVVHLCIVAAHLLHYLAYSENWNNHSKKTTSVYFLWALYMWSSLQAANQCTQGYTMLPHYMWIHFLRTDPWSFTLGKPVLGEWVHGNMEGKNPCYSHEPTPHTKSTITIHICSGNIFQTSMQEIPETIKSRSHLCPRQAHLLPWLLRETSRACYCKMITWKPA